MDFKIDFSGIDLVALRDLNVGATEIESVVVNTNSFFQDWGHSFFLLGFSSKRKFIKIAYRVAKNPNFDIEILQVDLPNESDIENYWCQREK